MRSFWALVVARNREFIRDKGTLGWNLGFPLVVIFGVAIIFAGPDRELYKVGLMGREAPAASAPLQFLDTRFVGFVPIDNLEDGLDKVRHHRLDMLLDLGDPPRYWINESNQNGYLLERMLMGAGAHPAIAKELLQGREVRYVDWLLPGVLAMNMMFSCLFGVGYVIVRYRKSGILRRFKVTPVSALQFISAQVVSRMILIMLTVALLYAGTDLVLDYFVLGSLLDLFIVFTVGGLCLTAMGLAVAARTHSEELAGGLLNLFSWPMMFLSGVWFSLEGADPWIRRAAQVLPLTPLIDASRKIMIDGAGLLSVLPELATLAGMTVLFLGLGAYLFRWE
ncbi:MAG: ABC transporter permease [Candidatus Lambdaproteobacteria bacterium]|nr:ABC transporter permease [Candidatus Lambdaproteobacteria bacterium]